MKRVLVILVFVIQSACQSSENSSLGIEMFNLDCEKVIPDSTFIDPMGRYSISIPASWIATYQDSNNPSNIIFQPSKTDSLLISIYVHKNKLSTFKEEMEYSINDFKTNYPDVTIIQYGKSKVSVDSLLHFVIYQDVSGYSGLTFKFDFNNQFIILVESGYIGQGNYHYHICSMLDIVKSFKLLN